jgi:hypothetical protein
MVLVSKPLKKLDVLEDNIGRIEFVVPTVVIDELKNLMKSGSAKKANAARLALNVVEKFRKVRLEAGSADEAIIEYALKHRCYVATIDNMLKNKLKDNGIDVITLVKDNVIVA